MPKTLSQIALALAIILACSSCDSSFNTARAEQHELFFGNAGEVYTLNAGPNHNWVLPMGNTKILIAPHASGSSVTGFDRLGYEEGDSVYIRNQSLTQTLPLRHMDAGSTFENQLALPWLQDLELGPLESVQLDWDVTLGCWSTWTPARPSI